MLVFITGPSAAGKSFLRDYYMAACNIEPIVAVTTRKNRKKENEIHRSLDEKTFKNLQKNDELCLVKKNHGKSYGYLKKDFRDNQYGIQLIEVDSKTALSERKKFNAKIIRIIPHSISKALVTILRKRNGVPSRILDLLKQTRTSYVQNRLKQGDIIFYNLYNQDSCEKFLNTVNTLKNKK